ncbi:hypothetical protein P171DRAFT_455564 [Karstenula rhodostoma CBS 690.94]|uniref:Tat pathway signal sequence n=1 Tax=Karstenula rhodostoma CBS 690.94 TaxID=1392251 RepID=A0A9P4PGX5_9PLEO|nr:hypothetical protein P171DRAFT_455564 [Karstenula rhodostoma CBS 690.94]
MYLSLRDILTGSELIDAEEYIASSVGVMMAGIRKCQRKRFKRDLRVGLKSCVLTSCVWLLVLVVILNSWEKRLLLKATDEACLEHISQYSPLIKEVEPKWHDVRFNGTFLHENVYRQGAGPEVDAAWEALGVDYRPIVVPLEKAEESGLRPDQVRVEDIYDGGFVANVEGLHHLHCLNILRKSLHWNYDYYMAEKKPPFSNSQDIVRIHVTHCLDILRQQLMCVPDIGVLGQVWYKLESMPQPMPFVDFNTEHRCRDFESVRTWAERHQLPDESEVDLEHFYRMPEPGGRIYSEIP